MPPISASAMRIGKTFGKTFNEFVGHTVSEIFGDEFFNEVIKPHAELCLKGEEINYRTAVFNP